MRNSDGTVLALSPTSKGRHVQLTENCSRLALMLKLEANPLPSPPPSLLPLWPPRSATRAVGVSDRARSCTPRLNYESRAKVSSPSRTYVRADRATRARLLTVTSRHRLASRHESFAARSIGTCVRLLLEERSSRARDVSPYTTR